MALLPVFAINAPSPAAKFPVVHVPPHPAPKSAATVAVEVMDAARPTETSPTQTIIIAAARRKKDPMGDAAGENGNVAVRRGGSGITSATTTIPPDFSQE